DLKYLIIAVIILVSFALAATDGEVLDDIIDMSLEELLSTPVTTASLRAQSLTDAPSNIAVVTREMIERRGYRSLVEVLEDQAGFDFLNYEDGGGENATFVISRGIGGGLANVNLLIMVDGIPQNFINFNWATLFTFEGLFNDLDRIEIIGGPGSSLYGAQAFSGVINFITKAEHMGLYAKAGYGSNNTRDMNVHFGHKVSNKFHFSLALRKFDTDGDDGDRIDPGGYFHGNIAPYFLTQHYDPNGNYVTNYPNPRGGQPLPDGFATWADTLSFRLKVTAGNTEFGAFYWDNNRASASYISGFEYYVTGDTHRSHQRGYHAYAKNSTDFSKRFSLESTLVYRTSIIMPKTGAEYTYRFDNMVKSYSSFSNQAYLEERLSYMLNDKDNLLFGFRLMSSAKTQRAISLAQYADMYSSEVSSSWDIAASGGGLYQSKNTPTINVFEVAMYGLINNQWSEKFATSVGGRFDYSSEFGSIFNPRLSLIYKPMKQLNLKLLYGSAFRQPGIYELTSEFYGNPDLEPEKIKTYELEVNSRLSNKLNLRMNIFYSSMTDFIGFSSAPEKPSGRKYDNIAKSEVRGLSLNLNFEPIRHFMVFGNYMFTEGKALDGEWGQHSSLSVWPRHVDVLYSFGKPL
ncbi:MAG: TonB-dependent receptor, partial [bacterium]|nr:TonB-dependent receptor [bacterium]